MPMLMPGHGEGHTVYALWHGRDLIGLYCDLRGAKKAAKQQNVWGGNKAEGRWVRNSLGALMNGPMWLISEEAIH